MASSIKLQRLDHDSDASEGSRMAPIEHLATKKAALSNAAHRPRAGASELATRHSFGTVRLPWSGMRV